MTTLQQAIQQHLAVDEDGLRKCPCCGSEVYSRPACDPKNIGGWTGVWCPECKAMLACESSKERLRQKFNTRTSDALLLEALRRLEVAEEYLRDFGFTFAQPDALGLPQEQYYERIMAEAEREAKAALAVLTAPYGDDT